jgi:hypothetical protein
MRRWPKSRQFAVSLLAATILTSCGSVTAGARHAQMRTNAVANSDGAVPDPWIQYITAVNPGSALASSSPTHLVQVAGQGGAPHLDQNLAAGPSGTSMDWPGSDVQLSTDGGQSWHTVLAPSDGVWSVAADAGGDFWAVSVTSLYGSSDGATWQRLGEPSTAPLAQVDFVSMKQGFGLTDNGAFVSTVDGGLTWQPEPTTPSPSVSVCFTNATAGFLLEPDGSVLQTSNAGITWTQSETAPLGGRDQPLIWGSLTCSGNEVLSSLILIDPQSQSSTPYVISSGQVDANGQANWSVLASSASNDTALSLPSASSPVDDLGGSTLVSGTPVIAGDSSTRFAAVFARQTANASWESATTPALPSSVSAPSAVGYVHFHGFTVDSGAIFASLDDSALGTSAAPLDQPIVEASTDGGSSWKIVHESPPQPPPPPDEK